MAKMIKYINTNKLIQIVIYKVLILIVLMGESHASLLRSIPHYARVPTPSSYLSSHKRPYNMISGETFAINNASIIEKKPHSADHFNLQREFWWNRDFLDLMAQRWHLQQVATVL